jgi:hypothetical protein
MVKTSPPAAVIVVAAAAASLAVGLGATVIGVPSITTTAAEVPGPGSDPGRTIGMLWTVIVVGEEGFPSPAEVGVVGSSGTPTGVEA